MVQDKKKMPNDIHTPDDPIGKKGGMATPQSELSEVALSEDVVEEFAIEEVDTQDIDDFEELDYDIAENEVN